MTPLTAARSQMAVSLAFHIIFAALGVGLPLLMFIAEGLGMRRRDTTWYSLAKRWSKAFGILYAIGAVSGTILSFELGLLWPRFMRFAGPVFGLAFYLEAVAFFIEGVFLGVYLYSWDKLSPFWHWLCCLPLVIGGIASSLFVTTANAWMNTPAGFNNDNGVPVNIHPVAALLNPSAPWEAIHMTVAALEATAFGVAGVYAFAMLRGRRGDYERKGMVLGMAVGSILAPIQIWVGDQTARMVAHTQPAKLAAMEGLFQTTRYAPLTLFGWPDPASRQTYFGIQIQDLLSFLSFEDTSAPVRGLDSFPPGSQPDARLLHIPYDTMAGIGFALTALMLWFWYVYFRRREVVRRNAWGKWLLRAVYLSGPASFLAIELGWMVTELGRQPYIIYNIMYVANGVTTARGLLVTFPTFVVLYMTLGIATTYFLLRLGREHKDKPIPIEEIMNRGRRSEALPESEGELNEQSAGRDAGRSAGPDGAHALALTQSTAVTYHETPTNHRAESSVHSTPSVRSMALSVALLTAFSAVAFFIGRSHERQEAVEQLRRLRRRGPGQGLTPGVT